MARMARRLGWTGWVDEEGHCPESRGRDDDGGGGFVGFVGVVTGDGNGVDVVTGTLLPVAKRSDSQRRRTADLRRCCRLGPRRGDWGCSPGREV